MIIFVIFSFFSYLTRFFVKMLNLIFQRFIDIYEIIKYFEE